MTDVVITDLFIHPVKSLAGLRVSAALATASGLAGDRQWAIFRPDNTPLTQRQNPRMALITPKITERGLQLSAPGHSRIEVDEPEAGVSVQQFNIWKDISEGRAAAGEVNAWLTEFLRSRVPLRLIKARQGAARVFHDHERFSVAAQFFSDAAPYLVCNLASLQALNDELNAKTLPPVDIRHFRANIVLAGLPAFTEHNFTHLLETSGSGGLRLVDHCQRCSIITVNPDTGERLPDAYPLTTLARINTVPVKPKAPAFGINSTLHGSTPLPLCVGQKMRVE